MRKLPVAFRTKTIRKDVKYLYSTKTKWKIFWIDDFRHYSQILVVSLPPTWHRLQRPSKLCIPNALRYERIIRNSLPVLHQDRRQRRYTSTICAYAPRSFCANIFIDNTLFSTNAVPPPTYVNYKYSAAPLWRKGKEHATCDCSSVVTLKIS